MNSYPFHGDFIGRRQAAEEAEPEDARPQPDGRAQPRPPSRRPRRSIALTAHILRGTGEIVDVDVCDLSYDGCKVRTPVYLWEKEQIKLSVHRRGVIESEVCWCTDGFAGLRFDPEEVPEKPEVERAEPRIKTRGEVQVRRIGSNPYRVDIRDLSRFGCKVELVERPRLDEVIMIRFDGLESLQARAKWVDGFVAGLKFETALHAAVFDLLAARIAADED